MRYELVISSMTWSYSRLRSFEACPYGWLQRYIFGVPDKQNFFSQFGGFMHKIMQNYLCGRLKKRELVQYYLRNFAQEVGEPAPTQKILENYLTQGRQYLRVLPLPESRVSVGIEEPISFQISGYPFVGILDWRSTDNGAMFITDHKSRSLRPRSNRATPTKNDVLLDDYLRQMYIYAIGLKEKIGVYPDFLEFNCFREQQWITEPFRIEKAEETEAWAIKLIEDIERTDHWTPNLDYWVCNHICGTAQACEYRSFL